MIVHRRLRRSAPEAPDVGVPGTEGAEPAAAMPGRSGLMSKSTLPGSSFSDPWIAAAEQRHGLRPAAFVRMHRPLDRVQQRRAEDAHLGQAGSGHHAVVLDARRRLDRLLARRHPVHDGAERVDVGPRALVALRVVLLERSEPGTHDVGHVPVGGHAAGRAEIQQDRRAVGTHVDVVGFDVPMQEARLVNGLQAVEQGVDDGQQGALRER
jgi:hypothetical protein